MSAPTVIFDIGNVLLDWDPRHLYRGLIPDEERREWFLREVCSNAWNREQDGGRSWEEAVEEAASRHPEWRSLIEAYHERWIETLGGVFPENVALLERLKARGERVYAITNFSGPKYRLAQERYPFLRLFDGVVVSGNEELLKPDPAIYELCLSRYGLVAGDCIFVDDSPVNVRGAEGVGMRAIHYTPGLDLAASLAAMGVAAAR